jgi:hypothetical protein
VNKKQVYVGQNVFLTFLYIATADVYTLLAPLVPPQEGFDELFLGDSPQDPFPLLKVSRVWVRPVSSFLIFRKRKKLAGVGTLWLPSIPAQRWRIGLGHCPNGTTISGLFCLKIFINLLRASRM